MDILDMILGKPDEGPIPGATGMILAKMGIHEIRPVQKGIPPSVLMGCRKKLFPIPGAERPAYTKEGKPVLAKNKAGRTYHVMEYPAVTREIWRSHYVRK